MLRGIIKDDVINKGFDQLDGENFSDWFARHGGSMLTISSPLSMNTPNLSYQYPDGATTRSPQMAAGAYLHWTLREFAYLGSFGWLFAAGTGDPSSEERRVGTAWVSTCRSRGWPCH